MNRKTQSRRRFLGTLAGTGAAMALGAPALSFAVGESKDTWEDDFSRVAPSENWTLAYQNAPADFPETKAVVQGTFPDAVCGTLFRNGAAGHDLGGLRYHHWFDGDGMVQRYAIATHAVSHFGRYVRTRKWQMEQAAGQRLFEAFGTKLPDIEPVSSPDVLNVANTSVLPLAGELLALWEGGSATRMDLMTLDTLGTKTWRADLAALPFSAHPRVQADGTVWNFGVGSGQDLLILYRISSQGILEKADAIPVANLPMIHDFVVTRNHLVFVMPPFVATADRMATMSFLDAHLWRPELGTRLLIIEKADWAKRRIIELPASFLFHLGNAWENEQGVITLDYARYDDPQIVQVATREVMRGRYAKTAAARLATLRIDTSSARVTEQVFPIDCEFPRVAAPLVGQRYRKVVHATRQASDHPGFHSVGITDIETGHTSEYDYGPARMVEEHLLIPGQSHDWVLGTSLDLKMQKTVLSCFHADHLEDGPVAQAALPYALPLGLHGAFVKAQRNV